MSLRAERPPARVEDPAGLWRGMTGYGLYLDVNKKGFSCIQLEFDSRIASKNILISQAFQA
jgi:hypothetical protein